jgi:hypothetical protein
MNAGKNTFKSTKMSVVQRGDLTYNVMFVIPRTALKRKTAFYCHIFELVDYEFRVLYVRMNQ